ncbi:hypothetical protein ACOSP7_015172 [Xanthoceras sorbifolium]
MTISSSSPAMLTAATSSLASKIISSIFSLFTDRPLSPPPSHVASWPGEHCCITGLTKEEDWLGSSYPIKKIMLAVLWLLACRTSKLVFSSGVGGGSCYPEGCPAS